MSWSRQVLVQAAAVAVAMAMMIVVFASLESAQPSATAQEAGAAAAPQGEYTGSKRCFACHFKEFMSWKKTKHSQAFANIPKKYYSDTTCMKCHITGYGVPGGYQGASTPDLLGVTCEACHGPGSKHEEIAKQFTNKKVLSDEEKKAINGVIQRTIPNVCINCHLEAAGHKEHPKVEEKEKK